MFDQVEAFYRPSRIQEAVRLLHKGGKGCFVAGGTDVAVRQDRSINFLVDVTQLGLSYIRRAAGGVTIGATTTLSEVAESPVLQSLAGGILARAACSWGPVQIRNMATVGGNLANASPSADLAVALLALDAAAVVAMPRGRRRIPLRDFFRGPHETALAGGLLVEVAIPLPPRGARTAWAFHKLGRTENDLAVVNVAAGLQCGDRGMCTMARLALGAVAPVPLRACAAEKLLTGRKLGRALVEAACEAATAAISPIDDVRGTADYRRHVAGVLAARALEECAAQAGCPL